jgi:hypothetical protein
VSVERFLFVMVFPANKLTAVLVIAGRSESPSRYHQKSSKSESLESGNGLGCRSPPGAGPLVLA